MVRDKMLLHRRVNLKRVILTDGRYNRVSRRNIPENVTTKIATVIGLRQQRKRK